jgi:predicted molibdopterin-dependent oxidoreductase YjgC
MRGRAAMLWQGVLARLLESGTLSRERVAAMPGGEALLAGLQSDLAAISDATGVEEGAITKAAEIIGAGERIVFVHSPDRPQDQAAGDLETFADLLMLLRAAGKQAELLLPRLSGNIAGIEIAGADPAFLAGRRPAGKLPGARSHGELRELLEKGRIKAALVIGEDPMEHARTSSYFQNIEFLAAVDWTATETTRFADIALPGTTYLESDGTRCNFEGRLVPYTQAVAPPSGRPGWQVLAELAAACGIDLRAESAAVITAALERDIQAGLGPLAAFYWNRGEPRDGSGAGALAAPDVRGRARPIPPALTHGGRYKRGIREVGTARFRVH